VIAGEESIMLIMRFIIAILVGYLLGSIPSGLIAGRIAGVDVRRTGSGKTGATNVLRSAGWKAGLLVAAADTLKGALPVLLAQHVLGVGRGISPTAAGWMAACAGLAAIAGHNYPIYVGFKGGRGVAATGGMGLALALPPTLLTAIFFIIPIAVTRYVSLGSMIGATALPFLYLGYAKVTQPGHALTGTNLAYFTALFIAAVAIDVSHHDNIRRILNGTERKLGERATPVPAK
jgi:glycerol-3-phosphate acyltransferase PlsY